MCIYHGQSRNYTHANLGYFLGTPNKIGRLFRLIAANCLDICSPIRIKDYQHWIFSEAIYSLGFFLDERDIAADDVFSLLTRKKRRFVHWFLQLTFYFFILLTRFYWFLRQITFFCAPKYFSWLQQFSSPGAPNLQSTLDPLSD